MNRIVIPTILVATVMIAGIFAFAPVEKASTVHDQIIAAIEGNTIVRKTLDIQEDNTWTQVITFNRIDGTGAFQVEKLFVCDLWNNTGFIDIAFDVETTITGLGMFGGQPSLLSAEGNPPQTGIAPSANFENECIDLMVVQYNRGGSNQGEVGDIHLGGDSLNNVNVRFQDSSCGNVDPNGAVIVAYFKGLGDAGQIQGFSAVLQLP